MELTLAHSGPLSLDHPRMMGILNVTPDSFSDPGQFLSLDHAVAHGLEMARQGASIIDIGGESTRPGAQRIPADQQKQRVLNVVHRLRRELDAAHLPAAISIDTTLAPVAHAALDAGAEILNDVSAGREDPDMLTLAAEKRCPIVLMHMQGTPATMQSAPTYDDVVTEVESFLLQRAQAAQRAGISRHQIVIDPGIGFGKTVEHNLTLLANLNRLVATGYPVLLGASRKRFIAAVDTADAASATPDRLGGTCATTALGVAAGVRLFRVHDVAANRQAAAVAWAVAQVKNP
jgi:dihydropteroate synthase